jgi:hypothetical protein
MNARASAKSVRARYVWARTDGSGRAAIDGEVVIRMSSLVKGVSRAAPPMMVEHRVAALNVGPSSGTKITMLRVVI